MQCKIEKLWLNLHLNIKLRYRVKCIIKFMESYGGKGEKNG